MISTQNWSTSWLGARLLFGTLPDSDNVVSVGSSRVEAGLRSVGVIT